MKALPSSPEGRIHTKSGSMESLMTLSGNEGKGTNALKKYVEKNILSEEAVDPGQKESQMSKCEFMNIRFAPVLRRGNHEIEEEIKEASTNYGDIENQCSRTRE